MNDIRRLTDSELVDLLSEQTKKLTGLLAGPVSKEDYHQCKLFIHALILEIQTRKTFKNDPTIADSDIILEQE